MKPNDKPQKTADSFEDPQLILMVGDETFPKPGLETAFVDFSGFTEKTHHSDSQDDEDIYGGVVCSCNRVYVSSSQRTLRRAHTSSPFENIKMREKSSGGSRGGGGCRCAPVS
jgi:hypothetical protein